MRARSDRLEAVFKHLARISAMMRPVRRTPVSIIRMRPLSLVALMRCFVSFSACGRATRPDQSSSLKALAAMMRSALRRMLSVKAALTVRTRHGVSSPATALNSLRPACMDFGERSMQVKLSLRSRRWGRDIHRAMTAVSGPEPRSAISAPSGMSSSSPVNRRDMR